MANYDEIFANVKDSFSNTKKSYVDRFKGAASTIYENKDSLTDGQLLQLNNFYNDQFKSYMSNLRQKNKTDLVHKLSDERIKKRKDSVQNQVYYLNKTLRGSSENDPISEISQTLNEKGKYTNRLAKVYQTIESLTADNSLSQSQAKNAQRQVDNIVNKYLSSSGKKVKEEYKEAVVGEHEKIQNLLNSYVSSSGSSKKRTFSGTLEKIVGGAYSAKESLVDKKDKLKESYNSRFSSLKDVTSQYSANESIGKATSKIGEIKNSFGNKLKDKVQSSKNKVSDIYTSLVDKFSAKKNQSSNEKKTGKVRKFSDKVSSNFENYKSTWISGTILGAFMCAYVASGCTAPFAPNTGNSTKENPKKEVIISVKSDQSKDARELKEKLKSTPEGSGLELFIDKEFKSDDYPVLYGFKGDDKKSQADEKLHQKKNLESTEGLSGKVDITDSQFTQRNQLDDPYFENQWYGLRINEENFQVETAEDFSNREDAYILGQKKDGSFEILKSGKNYDPNSFDSVGAAMLQENDNGGYTAVWRSSVNVGTETKAPGQTLEKEVDFGADEGNVNVKL
ncbi:MAG: hypothetical protein ACQESF_05560 [Nanobdellota archaeon]